MKIAAGNAVVESGEAVTVASPAVGEPVANFASFLVKGGSVFPFDPAGAVPIQTEANGVAAEGVGLAPDGAEPRKTLGVGQGSLTTPAGDEIGRGQLLGGARPKAGAADAKAGPRKQKSDVTTDSNLMAGGTIQTPSESALGAAWTLGHLNAGLTVQAASADSTVDDREAMGVSLPMRGVAEPFAVGLPAGQGDDVSKDEGAAPSAEMQDAGETQSAAALTQEEQAARSATGAALESVSQGVDVLRQKMDAAGMGLMSEKNSQKSTHEISLATDKIYIPAETSFVTPLVAPSATAPMITRPGYSAGHGWNASPDAGFLQDDVDRVSETATIDTVIPAFTGNGKNDAHEGSNPGATHGTPSPGSSSLQAGAGVIPSPFGLTLAGEPATMTSARRTGAEMPHTATLSSSDESAMERLQMAGATRALGSALQSSLGLGVQTESFGRVTIHTATEGTQLRAELTLEDGRQSATLVSHVPAVEQRLMQQLGLETAVRVLTGGTQPAGGGVAGESGRDAPQPQRQESYGKSAGAGANPVAELATVGIAAAAAWSGNVSPGRLDIRV